MRLTAFRVIAALAILPISPLVEPRQAPGALPFDSGWTLRGERTAIVRDGARDVVQVETGFADRRDVQLLDGTIDVDVQLTRRRSFVYVHFRALNENEREEFYLRPHKSGLPDALQYAPVWQGRSAWQLHHGPGGTAATGFTPGEWTHARIVVKGQSAALFVGDMSSPALLVPRLSREPKPGYISLGGFLPADVPGEGPIARFANVVVRPGVVAFDLDRAVAAEKQRPPEDGKNTTVIREWAVSRAFAPADATRRALPDAAAAGPFARIAAEPGGLVQLHRHVEVAPASRLTAAVARVIIRAERDMRVPLDLGFSDIATVFVNGVPLFTGDASYSFDRPRREGLVGYDQARVYLPLKAGENELSVLLADGFGGWGIMGRLETASGLRLEAR